MTDAYRQFLADLEQAKFAARPGPGWAQMHPDTGAAILSDAGVDPAIVEQVMDGTITDHPFLRRVDGGHLGAALHIDLEALRRSLAAGG